MATDLPPPRAWIDQRGVLWIESVAPPPVAPAVVPPRPWNAFTWFLVIVGVLVAVATPLALTGRILTIATSPAPLLPDVVEGAALAAEPDPGPAVTAAPPTAQAAPVALPHSAPTGWYRHGPTPGETGPAVLLSCRHDQRARGLRTAA